MFNLGLGDQTKRGSLLDTVMQIAFPAYGLMRNAQGLFTDERDGTITGWGMNKMDEPGGLFGSDQPTGQGLVGQSPNTSGYSFGDDGGFFGTGWGAKPIGQATTIDDAYSEVGGYASYDSPYAATDAGDMEAEDDWI
jgi:hypothetical protein